MKQLIFALVLVLTLGIFSYSMLRLYRLFKLTKGFPVGQYGKRLNIMLKVAIGQTKILRYPYTGLAHALVFWGFMVITFGSLEMVFDGLINSERAFSGLGVFYDILIASGDVFGLIVFVGIIIFLLRRLFFHPKRFEGIEMKALSHYDANIALSIILLLMVSLLGMNTFYYLEHSTREGIYPVSMHLAHIFQGMDAGQIHFWHEINWWTHILLIFLFANILPYSKHFHVFTSIPNVYLSRLEPLGQLNNMPEITKEVKMMLEESTEEELDESEPGRFGVSDIEDITWKNYLDSLACTQCGRCTAACPANITGKRLSPRKIIMNVRQRMKEKGPRLIKGGASYSDQLSLISENYIHEEELWACTTCNACAQECPVNINHPSLIIDMRRYLSMEQGNAPTGINAMNTNIQNNGAPWQYPPEDRLKWTEELTMNLLSDKK